MSDETTLLPCPFCGGEPYYYAPGPAEHHIECVQCHAETDGWMKKEQAIEAWNTRAERTCENINEQRNENGVLLRCDGRIFKCSECGFRADDFYGDDEQGFPRFCPNCGAKVVD